MDEKNKKNSYTSRASAETSRDDSALFLHKSPADGAIDGLEERQVIMKSNVIPQLVVIGFVVVIAMMFYEFINERIFSNAVLWGSHIGAVLCSTLTVIITAYVILNRYQTLLIKNAQDIAERRRVEGALRESEELYRAVVESVADGIAITRGTDRVFVNRTFLEIHGINDPSKVLGQPFDRFILPEDREAVRERILARQRGDMIDPISEYRIQRPDGNIRSLQASIALINYNGRPSTLAVLRDVTEIKEAETEIIRLNKELEQHIRNLEMSNHDLETFNSTVSHDLRTPLIAIDGFSRRMAERYGHTFDQKCADYLGIVRKNAQRMGRLIDDLLAYSRLGRQGLHHETIRMEKLFKVAIDDLRSVYPEGEVVISRLPDSFGDERVIRQVVMNMLGNAFKFTKHRDKRIIEVKGWEEESENVYSIKDNGAGFDMAHKDKLFEIFSRLHSEDEFEGTGIGLAIVKRIVDLHGGRVWAEGKPDAGATFCFSLPKASVL
ncbi:MAG: hypothetical protein C0392_11420 [Syntrophus sp. (in: bacteria)]|nr:hypothetical protein [Syntrophus sp. (in: bacteria)]